jgi:ATP-dependent RNA helicase DDX46/PRP5
VTFITEEQDRYSVDLYRALKASNANVPKDLEDLSTGTFLFASLSVQQRLRVIQGFLEKVKAGKAQQAGSGFGGKGLDRLDKERDAREKAERKAYGEDEKDEKVESTESGAAGTPAGGNKPEDMFSNFKVEVRRGPAPDSSKGLLGVAGAAAAARRLVHAKEEEKLQASLRAAEEAAARAGKDTPAYKQASSVVAKLNAQLRAAKLVAQSQLQVPEPSAVPRPSGDAAEFHAIIPINDYPQKARWRVTNKETMVQVSMRVFR